MNFKDFFFSYKTIINSNLNKKNFFKAFKKIFGYPNKYFIKKIRVFFLFNKINLDKYEKFSNIKVNSKYKEFF